MFPSCTVFNHEDTLDVAQNIEAYHCEIPRYFFSYYKEAHQQHKNHHDFTRICPYHHDIPACDITLRDVDILVNKVASDCANPCLLFLDKTKAQYTCYHFKKYLFHHYDYFFVCISINYLMLFS